MSAHDVSRAPTELACSAIRYSGTKERKKPSHTCTAVLACCCLGHERLAVSSTGLAILEVSPRPNFPAPLLSPSDSVDSTAAVIATPRPLSERRLQSPAVRANQVNVRLAQSRSRLVADCSLICSSKEAVDLRMQNTFSSSRRHEATEGGKS